jgi:hypothetical protein
MDLVNFSADGSFLAEEEPEEVLNIPARHLPRYL